MFPKKAVNFLQRTLNLNLSQRCSDSSPFTSALPKKGSRSSDHCCHLAAEDSRRAFLLRWRARVSSLFCGCGCRREGASARLQEISPGATAATVARGRDLPWGILWPPPSSTCFQGRRVRGAPNYDREGTEWPAVPRSAWSATPKWGPACSTESPKASCYFLIC